jgi:hypothetical protein
MQWKEQRIFCEEEDEVENVGSESDEVGNGENEGGEVGEL